MSIFLEVTVVPKSSQKKIVLGENNHIKIYLNSPPIDGQANKECLEILSKNIGLPKSKITIVKGHKGRKKQFSFEGISPQEIIAKLKQ